MLKKLLFLLCFTGFLVPMALAQTGTLTGTVTDASTGETVPGANILIQENQRGDATDENGEYSIPNLPVGTYTVRVTFVGYNTFRETVEVGPGENVFNIELTAGAIDLEELVVTGFGTTEKRELTGSISQVSSEDFQDVPAQNTAEILQGRSSGVRVTTTSGTAGAGFDVQVRGLGSINAGSDPLYVVDGVQLSFSNQSEEVDESPLNNISPQDIESIEVLKDAAAASIYGTQGANGVVLITTKRGQAGETQVDASYQRGIRTQIDNIDYMNRDQFIEFNLRAIENDLGVDRATATEVFNGNISVGGVADLTDFGYAAGTPFSEVDDFDWEDFVRQTGTSQKADFSISGGDQITRFRISGSWEGTEDYVRSSEFERFGFRMNLDHEVSSKFSVGTNLSLSNQTFDGVCQDGFFINCPISAGAFEPPVVAPFNEDGSFSTDTRFGLPFNPALFLGDDVERNTSTVQILGDLNATYNFKPWLSLRGQFGVDNRSTVDKEFSSPLASPGVNGDINESEARTININTNVTLNARRTFADVHNVQALLGGEYRRDFTREVEATGDGLPNSLFRVIDATATPSFASGFENEFRIAGYFGNFKYNFDERYFVSFTGRFDGSSRFGEDERWGFFPAVSGRWSVSEESFFNIDLIDDLSFRASWGQTGNSLIGLFESRGLFGTSGSFQGVTGLTPTQLANPQLTWETSEEINLGLDYSLFRGRFSGSIDVFQRDNKDLLLANPLPLDSSFGSITENVGQVRNKGLEIEFNSINISRNDFQWSTNLNVSFLANEVRSLTQGVQALNPAAVNPIQVGEDIRAIRVPRWAGVNPADGRPLWLDKDGELTYDPQEEDEVFVGDGTQDITGGIGSTFNYKNFSLNVLFNFGFGQRAQAQQVFFFGKAQIISSNVNGVVEALTESWQKPGDIAELPRPNLGSSAFPETDFFSQSSSNTFEETDFLRLRNLRVGYTLPNRITDQLNIRGISLFLSGQNLVTWTSFSGFDPEVAGTATAASIPPARVINGGVNFQF